MVAALRAVGAPAEVDGDALVAHAGNVWADLSAKTLTVEVIAKSTASPDLNLGNLGRSSIADISVAGLVADPATRTISVNAPAVLQPIAAEVLNGFVKVYAGYLEQGAYLEYCANPIASPGGCAEPRH